MARRADFFRGKVVLITGASSGIGEELAWQLGQAGAHLTLAARRVDALAALAARLVAAGQPQPLAAGAGSTWSSPTPASASSARCAILR